MLTEKYIVGKRGSSSRNYDVLGRDMPYLFMKSSDACKIKMDRGTNIWIRHRTNIVFKGGVLHMAERKLTVYKGTTKDYEPIPRISLQGQWLEELGFSIGDKLTIICQKGELVISKAVGKSIQQA